MEDISPAYAITWFQLFSEGLQGLPFDDPPEFPFVLYHDDFDTHNILVSHSDPTMVVGILDWEGSRIAPLWDRLRLGRILTDSSVDDPDELRRLRTMELDIHQDAQLYTGYSRLHLMRLLRIADYGHSIRSKRAELEGLFLEWHAGVCAAGRSDEIHSFRKLKEFIEQGIFSLGS